MSGSITELESVDLFGCGTVTPEKQVEILRSDVEGWNKWLNSDFREFLTVTTI